MINNYLLDVAVMIKKKTKKPIYNIHSSLEQRIHFKVFSDLSPLKLIICLSVTSVESQSDNQSITSFLIRILKLLIQNY